MVSVTVKVIYNRRGVHMSIDSVTHRSEKEKERKRRGQGNEKGRDVGRTWMSTEELIEQSSFGGREKKRDRGENGKSKQEK